MNEQVVRAQAYAKAYRSRYQETFMRLVAKGEDIDTVKSVAEATVSVAVIK